MLAVVWAAAALCAEPQCFVSGTQSCLMRVDGAFGKTVIDHAVYSHAGKGLAYPASAAGHMCKKSSWDGLDRCGWLSDFRLTIVEPAMFATSIPLRDFGYTPYSDAQHIDQTHPVHGKVLDVVLPAGRGRHGCSASDWAGTGVAGQIMLTWEGHCFSFNRMHAALASGQRPAALIMSGWDAGLELYRLFGPSAGTDDIPAMKGAGALYYMALEAEERNLKMRAKIELVCPGDTPDPAPPPAYADGCPDDKLSGICDNAAEPADRLCSRCPLQLKRGDEAHCLYRARLYPARKENFLQNVLQVPSELNVTHVHFDGPWMGCSLGDFAGVSGRIVAFNIRPCMPLWPMVLNSVRLAERQGAAGVILLSDKLVDYQPIGISVKHNIPVHVVNGYDSRSVLATFTEEHPEGVRHGGTVHRTVAWKLVDEAVAPEPVFPATPPPDTRAITEADTASFEFTPPVVASLVLIAATSIAIAVKLARTGGRAEHNVQMRELAAEGATGVPLRVVSTVLSVSLLLVVLAIACSLSARAAQQATDVAASHGEDAADMTYSNAVENVDKLAEQLRHQVLGQVSDRLSGFLTKGIDLVKDIELSMAQYDGTWAGFQNLHHNGGVGFTLAVSERGAGWHTSVKTVQDFYADKKWMTDFTSPGASDALNASQSGLVSGLKATGWSARSRMWLQTGSVIWRPSQLDESPLMRVGGELEEPLALVKRLKLAQGTHAWRVAAEGIPFSAFDDFAMPWLSVTVLRPVYGSGNQLIAAAAAAISVAALHHELAWVARLVSVGNTSILIFDAETLHLVGSTHHSRDEDMARRVDHYYSGYDTYAQHFRVRMVNESLDVADNALFHALQGPAADTGEFDQREYYSHPDLHSLNIVAGPEGRAVDKSADALVLNMDGPCGACVAPDPDFTNVLLFDGSSTLFVDMNLTTDIPYVAAKRRGGAGDPWASDELLYRYAMPLPGTDKECIYGNMAVNQQLGAARRCSLRGLADFFHSSSYTVSVRVKPDADVSPGDREQKLFEQTVEGNSMFTLYASGALVLGLSQGDCLVTGTRIPGGAWTTITARRDVATEMCEVWLNSTLHQRSTLKFSPLQYYSEPFGVGRGLRGAMESVRAFHMLVDPVDLVGRAYVRSVPSKRWFVAGVVYPLDGAEWLVSVRIPREDVMRSVDDNNKYLNENLRQQAANTRAKLDRDLAESVLVTAMAVMVSVCVFLVFNDLLTRLFSDVSVVMCDAAVMRIEEVPESTSIIAELNAMQLATRLMLANLKEYRTFIPKALLAGSTALGNGHQECKVAIVFTDIVSSSLLWGACEAAMSVALFQHNDIIRHRIEEFEGYEIKTIGDAFMCAFPSAMNAVEFGLTIQRDLLEAAWPDELLEHEAAAKTEDGAWNGIRIRIGVNYGTVEMVEERGRVDYFGPIVNVAARVESVCIPGAVCVTDAVMQAVELEEVLGGAVSVPMGERKLKGVARPEVLHLLVAMDLSARLSAVQAKLAAAQLSEPGEKRDGSASASSRSDNSASTGGGGLNGGARVGMRKQIIRRAAPMLALASMSSRSSTSLNPKNAPHDWEYLDRKRCAVGRTLFHFTSARLSALAEPLQVMQAVLAAALGAAQASHGTVHFVFGTTALLSWQQPRAIEHTKHAFAYVGLLTEALAKQPAEEDCRAHTGLVSGRTLVGNVGSSAHSQRFTTVLGGPFTLAELLSQSCAALPTAAALFACPEGNAVFQNRPIRRLLRPVDIWTAGATEARPAQSMTVYELRPHVPKSIRQSAVSNPLQGGAPVSSELSEADGGADWDATYWTAFETRTLEMLESIDPVVMAVASMQAAGDTLCPNLPMGPLGLLDGADGLRSYVNATSPGAASPHISRSSECHLSPRSAVAGDVSTVRSNSSRLQDVMAEASGFSDHPASATSAQELV